MFAAIPDGQTSYSVEVSGWDNNEDFFVERRNCIGPSNQESTFCSCGGSLRVRSCSSG